MSKSSAATSNTMLAICEKRTNRIDLYLPLRHHITVHYSEQHALNFEDDLQTLNKLRSDVDSFSASPPARKDLLVRYFNALCSIETEFPMSFPITTWFDAFNNKNKNKNKSTQQGNLGLEKASVMFNLGAVYSQIGASLDRSTVEGRKNAVSSFSSAAGAFAYLRDRLTVRATIDLSVECAGMLENLMLAQAQECVFENTLTKPTTPALSSKISTQIGIYYQQANAALVAAPLSAHFDKAWATHVNLKDALFYSEACFRYSLELHHKEEIAEEIARLKLGISALPDKNKRKSGKASFSQLYDAAIELEKNLNKNLERALKENDRVYLQRVPLPTSLAALPAVSLVKPVSMEDVLNASKEKLFAADDTSRIRALSSSTENMADSVIKPTSLPDHSSARAFSRSTDKGADRGIRPQEAQVRHNKLVMDLPEAVISLEKKATLPELQKIADLRRVRLQQLKDLTSVNQESVVQTQEMLQKTAQQHPCGLNYWFILLPVLLGFLYLING